MFVNLLFYNSETSLKDTLSGMIENWSGIEHCFHLSKKKTSNLVHHSAVTFAQLNYPQSNLLISNHFLFSNGKVKTSW